MTVGDLMRFLEGYDEDAEVEVEVRFAEAGEAYAPTFSVSAFSHDEMESGARNGWPTITADVGLGTMDEGELRLVIDHVKDIDHRLSYYGGTG